MDIFKHKNKIVCQIIRGDDKFKKKKQFFSNPRDSFQLGVLNFNKSDDVKLHYHPKRKRTVYHTSEVLFVKKGALHLSIFNKKGKNLKEFILNKGDIAYLCDIAHKIKFYKETEILEIKQGPYSQIKDKAFL